MPDKIGKRCGEIVFHKHGVVPEVIHRYICLLNKRLTDRNLKNEIVDIVVTAQSLINVTIKISVNKISIKETCSTFWKQSIMFAGMRL